MFPRALLRLGALTAGATLALAGCRPRAAAEGADSSAMAAPPPAPVAATPPPVSDTSWRMLFDGTSAAAWRGYRSASLPAGWRVEAGELRRVGEGGDIVSRDQFGDFELELEWKVGRGGNSGVMYRVVEGGDSSETYMSGPEMQVLDDAGHANGKVPLTSAGALYGLYPAPKGASRPAGEWNRARIVARGNHVEHWLNGVKTVEAELWSADWNARLAKSKFTEWPQFAKATRGHIALQDHGDPVAFRNIRIRELH